MLTEEDYIMACSKDEVFYTIRYCGEKCYAFGQAEAERVINIMRRELAHRVMNGGYSEPIMRKETFEEWKTRKEQNNATKE